MLASATSDENASRLLLWRLFIYGRIVVTGVLLGLLYIVNAFYASQDLAPLYAVVWVQFGLNAIYFFLWKRRDIALLSYICFVLEIVLITLMILNFGKDGYIFVLAYFWPIVMAGRLIGQKAILPLTLLSTILYTTIIFLQRQGLVSQKDIAMSDGTPQALILSLPYLVFVSLLLWALTDQMAHSERDLNRQNIELGRMNSLLGGILGHMNEGVFLVAHQGDVLLSNRRARELLHIQEGQPMPAWLDRQLTESVAGEEQVGGRMLVEFEKKMISLSIAAISAGSLAASTVYVARDVTPETQLERAKSDFLAYASHELRTPLATIKTMVHLLLMDEPSGSKAHEYLTVIDTQVDRQMRMVRNLLDLTRLEAGRYELPLDRIDLEPVIHSVVNAMRPLASTKGLAIEVVCGNLAEAQGRLLSNVSGVEQVLMNLLSNAIKFTEKGSISVTCGCQADQIWISVEDTGMGLTPEQLGRIFTKFYTTQNPRKRGEGTGLGLVISRMIVQALGGSIEANSTPGQGAKFTIYLPLGEERASSQPAI